MELGEQIELHGFTEDEYGEIIIVKKLVGNHVKQLMERLPSFERLTLTLDRTGEEISLNGVLKVAGSEYQSDVTDENLFFAIDKCLKDLGKQVS